MLETLAKDIELEYLLTKPVLRVHKLVSVLSRVCVQLIIYFSRIYFDTLLGLVLSAFLERGQRGTELHLNI